MVAVRTYNLSVLFFTIIYFINLGCTTSFIASNVFEKQAKYLPQYQHQHQHQNQIQNNQRIVNCRHSKESAHSCYGLFAALNDDYEDIVVGIDIDTTDTNPSRHQLQKKNDSKTTDKTRISSSSFLPLSTDVKWEGRKENLDSNNQEEKDLLTVFISFVKENLFLGIDPTPEILAIMTVYFVEGALSLAGLAQTYLLKDELSLGPAEMSAISGLFVLPWTIKPLYGFLSDIFPIFGYRRRSYLILAGILGSFSYAALGANFWGITTASFLPATTTVVLALLLASASIAISDVVADGIVVERTRDSTDPKIAGGLQSLCWGSAALGGLISSYFSGSLLEIMTPRNVFSITAILPLLVAGISLLIEEQPCISNTQIDDETSTALTDTTVIDESMALMNEQQQQEGAERNNDGDTEASSSQPIRTTQQQNAAIGASPPQFAVVVNQAKALWSAIKDPKVYKPALFLFLWQSTPTSGGAFFYFITNDLNMGPEFLGRVGLGSSVASLVGIWYYQKYLRTVAIKDILFWSSIVSVPLGLTDLLLITHTNRALGIPDAAFIFGDDAVGSVLGEIAFLPTLVLAAKICPPGVEALLFASLMSLFNASSVLGTELGAMLTKALNVTENNFDNLAALSLLCNLSSLYPLLFIGFLDEAGVGEESERMIENEKEEQLRI